MLQKTELCNFLVKCLELEVIIGLRKTIILCWLSLLDASFESLDRYISFGRPSAVRNLVRDHGDSGLSRKGS